MAQPASSGKEAMTGKHEHLFLFDADPSADIRLDRIGNPPGYNHASFLNA